MTSSASGYNAIRSESQPFQQRKQIKITKADRLSDEQKTSEAASENNGAIYEVKLKLSDFQNLQKG